MTGSPAEASGVRRGDSVRVKGGDLEPNSMSGFHDWLAGRTNVELEFGRGDTVREARLERAAYLPSLEFGLRPGR